MPENVASGHHETDLQFKKALEYYRLGHVHQAEKICKEICYTACDHAPALHLLGMTAYRRNRYDVAVNHIAAAVHISPDNATYQNDLGNAFLAQEKFDEAISCYRDALKLDPSFVRAYCRLSVALTRKGLLDEALQSLSIALKLKPDYTDALYQAGCILNQKNKPAEAINCFEKLLTLEPGRAEAFFALGTALSALDREDAAMASYGKALSIAPDHAYALNNIGLLLKERGEIDDAAALYRKAIETNADLEGVHWNLSHVFLLTGRFEAGWKEFEWRLKKDDWQKANLRHCKAPLWKGESLRGKTLFIHDEQGLGDTLQFIRYLPMVKALGGNTLFETQKSLMGLLKDFPGIDRLLPRSTKGVLPKDMDFYVPLLSLPAIFNTNLYTIPDTVPYLHADAGKAKYWKEQLKGPPFKVGIVWAGAPKHCNDRNRSCSLKQFEPLAKITGVRVIGIQKGKAAEQVDDLCANIEIVNYGPKLEDFTDTMGLIENLDLVISVDTAVAHLAGAMGKPVWTLLPFSPDWRWLLNRTDTPWYPSMRLYRQERKGAWAPVFERVLKDLRELVSEKSY